MCRCCQSCLEEIYWNCIEERFCYDESIAQYNPDDDEYLTKNCDLVKTVSQSDNNNVPICTQPSNRNPTLLSPKIHEEDYKRAIQTSVPILAPEILAVFANSQIFHEHEPKLTKSLTKTFLAGIHGKDKEIDQEKLIKHLEEADVNENEPKKKIKFTISPDSLNIQTPPELVTSEKCDLKEDIDTKEELPKEHHDIIEEQTQIIEQEQKDAEIILKPNKIEKHYDTNATSMVHNKKLRNVHSVPYFSFRPASETDIFAISGSMSKISMTPEIPSISFSMLPKNYEDTPTIEQYKESISLYSIQTANHAKAKSNENDYSMPRYFRRSNLVQSAENFNMDKDEAAAATNPKRHEKSKRLKTLRDSLPPLRIHSMRSKFKEEH